MMTAATATTECVRTESHVLEVARVSLHKSLSTSAGAVKCRFDGGILKLTGHLPSWYQKQLAQEAVKQLAGVGRVLNEITVSVSAKSSVPCTA